MENELIKRNIGKFYLASFFGSWAFVTGILIFHYRELGFTFTQIFILGIVYEVLNFILEIPTGILADLWSTKKVIIIGCLISGLSFFVVMINPMIYATYLLWAILSAVCTTLNSGAYDAYIYDSMQKINPDDYSKVLSKIIAISITTQAITIVLGGYISDRIGFTSVLLLSGIGGIVQAIILFTTFEPNTKNKEKNNLPLQKQLRDQISSSITLLKSNKIIRFFMYYGILFFIISEVSRTIFQPYISTLGFKSSFEIAIFSGISSLILAISSLMIGYIKNQSNENKILFIISIGLCVPLLLLGIPQFGLIALFFLYVSLGFGEIIFMDKFNRIIPSEKRATILSSLNQFASISYALVAIVVGLLIDHIGIASGALVIGGVILLLFLLLFSRYANSVLVRTTDE